jgi:hypothetical protein
MSSDPIGGYTEVKKPEGYAMQHPVYGCYFYGQGRKTPAAAKEWLRQFVGRAADDPNWIEFPVVMMGVDFYKGEE